MEVNRIFSKCKLFFNLTPQTLRQTIPLLNGYTRHLQATESFIHEDDTLDCLGILLRGKLCTIKIFEDGSQSMLQKMTVGNVVGVDIIFTKLHTSPYTIYAADDCDLFCFDYHLITEPGIIDESVRLIIMNNVLELLSHENIRKYHKLEILSRKSLRERIITYLSIQRHKYRSAHFSIQFNREELAEYLCVNRSALSHELSLMEQDGLISYSRNNFILSDKIK